MKTFNIVKNMGSARTRLATDFLGALPRLLSSLTVTQTSVQRGARTAPELLVKVVTPAGHTRTLCVEVRAAATPNRIPEALRQLVQAHPSKKTYRVLGAVFLSPRARQLCREHGVGYLDLAGNCFLRWEGFHLEKIVDKNPFPARGRPSSLFTAISSRIVRAMLEEPTRVWRVNALAAATDVSLGHISNVTRRLVDERYAVKTSGGLQLAQPGTLLDAWRESYTIEQHLGRGYYSFERDPEQLMARVASVAQAHQWRYALTSFGAAALVAPFVHGVATRQWYVQDSAAEQAWVQALDLRPAEAGPNVILRMPADAGVFYRARAVNTIQIVGAIQLYLDLYRDPARGQEQAEFLRKKLLKY